jgi:hypothetical protein
VEYINRTYKQVKGITATVDIFDINSRSLLHKSETVDLNAPEAKEGIQLADVIKPNNGISFVILNLKDQSGKRISHNAYWISPTEDFTSLNSMNQTTLDVAVNGFKNGGYEKGYTILVSNKSEKIAFFINPKLVTGDKEVAPCFWSANYFTLAPGESIILNVGFPPEVIGKDHPVLKIEGWNVKETEISLNK